MLLQKIILATITTYQNNLRRLLGTTKCLNLSSNFIMTVELQSLAENRESVYLVKTKHI